MSCQWKVRAYSVDLEQFWHSCWTGPSCFGPFCELPINLVRKWLKQILLSTCNPSFISRVAILNSTYHLARMSSGKSHHDRFSMSFLLCIHTFLLLQLIIFHFIIIIIGLQSVIAAFYRWFPTKSFIIIDVRKVNVFVISGVRTIHYFATRSLFILIIPIKICFLVVITKEVALELRRGLWVLGMWLWVSRIRRCVWKVFIVFWANRSKILKFYSFSNTSWSCSCCKMSR